MAPSTWDAVVVGSGPNGLASAITIASRGHRVLVLEANAAIGGGARTSELTLPGFMHDVCSAVHPLGASSPFFRSLRLERYGLTWMHADFPLVHPFDDGSAAVIQRDLAATVRGLGTDGAAYARMVGPLVRNWAGLTTSVLGPVVRVPRHPFLMARFGLDALQPATWLARRFDHEASRALFAGQAAHAMVPLEEFQTASFGLVLTAAAHASGWPVAEGGSVSIIDALVRCLRERGGVVECDRPVRSERDLPPARAYLFDVTPRQFAQIYGSRLPSKDRRRFESYRYGPGVFKLDHALAGPMPWTNADARRASTLHLGGTMREIAAGEREVAAGRIPARPFVIVSQPSVVDPSRAPSGHHTLWSYCHVPHGSTEDVSPRIEAQFDRFAPGWRDLVIGRSQMSSADYEAYNANYVGGDIGGGSASGLQLLFRPWPKLRPYSTVVPNTYLCSASTPPGAGVHGMCGYYAARAALSSTLS